ncbi:MAG: hypothetical protein IIB02_08280 [Thaumarchaeota archaeon]|nr:hypothetical protein [Nitrososphaerota archaeon]
MTKKDWSSVSLPKDLMSELDIFLDTEKAKKIGVNSRSQAISHILRQFVKNTSTFETGSNFENSKEKLDEMEKEMKDWQKKSTEAQKMMATMILTMTRNKKEFLPKEIFDRDLPIEQNFKKSEGIIGIEATENYMKIKDDKLSKPVMVEIKDRKLWCSYDKSNICKHIEYALLKNIGFLFNILKKEIEMPGEELMKKKLEEIINQNNE